MNGKVFYEILKNVDITNWEIWKSNTAKTVQILAHIMYIRQLK